MDRNSLILMVCALIAALIAGIFAPDRTKDSLTAANKRIERICRDVDSKLALARSWSQPEQADLAKTMVVTLDGVRAICQEK